jgi:DHA3 family macrolide efflux protein-like MFS transporter
MTKKSQVQSLSGLTFFRAYPSYTRYWIANTISRMGDSIDSIAVMWMVLELTGSTLLMGTVMLCNMLPNILLGPFAGVLADRFNRKKLMIFSDIARGLLVTVLATALTSIFETAQHPARAAVRPSLVRIEDLITSNSMHSFSETAAQMIGLACGGAIVATLGIGGALLIDFLTFIISALLISSIKIPSTTSSDGQGSDLTVAQFFKDLGEGLNYVRSTRIIVICAVLACLINFLLAPLNVLLPVFAKVNLNLDVVSLSYVFLAEPISMLLASLVVSFITKKIGERWALRAGLFLLASGSILFYFVKSAPGVFVCLSILIFGVPIASAGLHTIMQRNTPADKMGRVSSVMSTLSLAAMPLSTATAGFLGEVIPLPALFALLGSLVAFFTVLFTFNRTFRSNTVLGAAGKLATDT